MSTVKVIEVSEANKTLCVAMLESLVLEGLAREQAKTLIITSSASSWNLCRDNMFSAFDADADAEKLETDAFLSYFRDQCKANELKKGVQYASNLRRAVKLHCAGFEIPAEMRTAARDVWLDSPIWESIKGTQGGAAKSAPAAAPSKESDGGEGEDIGAVSVAVADDVRAIAEALDSLDANHRRQAFKEIIAVITATSARQRREMGGSR